MRDLDAAIIEVLYNSVPLSPEEIKKEIKRRFDHNASVSEIRDRISVMIRNGELVYATVERV